MKCLIGLGNPGDHYKNTKHNFGYWVIDSYLKKHQLKLKLGKGDYVFADDNNCIVAKTTTFMNNSGHAVKTIIKDFNCSIEDVIIIYDDIDLTLGAIKFKSTGSSGGHRGLDSIIYHLRSENFSRLRLGIATKSDMRPSEKYVLKSFPSKYNEAIASTVDKACEGLRFFLNNTIDCTMNQFNRRVKGES
ncbi:MAG: aminoacyl-tRNA hydrolase [Candidatus Marinimicrobia bacterium]|nr:aminoacyl-tRNA hydrolase [Candidatus Neomarinimicrobiota bacterium]|tara:strand:- start:1399 stop:1965 length:567 start_codon:yes stop_codon:yes gene_type:complete